MNFVSYFFFFVSVRPFFVFGVCSLKLLFLTKQFRCNDSNAWPLMDFFLKTGKNQQNHVTYMQSAKHSIEKVKKTLCHQQIATFLCVQSRFFILFIIYVCFFFNLMIGNSISIVNVFVCVFQATSNDYKWCCIF